MNLRRPTSIIMVRPSHALVYFKQEREYDIVAVADIKKFKPKNLSDLKKNKVYAVKWGNRPNSKNGQTQTQCYEAFILQLAESEDVLQQDILTSDARLRIPNVTISEPLTETKDESTSIEVAQKQLVANEKKQKSEKQVAASKHIQFLKLIWILHRMRSTHLVGVTALKDGPYSLATDGSNDYCDTKLYPVLCPPHNQVEDRLNSLESCQKCNGPTIYCQWTSVKCEDPGASSEEAKDVVYSPGMGEQTEDQETEKGE
ncbi:uncharacterized protein LOC117108188 [Anneissia japonica]|uniref:uncharacterized protein LOC117108188 n=1 Tax=Anneissia japonica TaxID=1529436 RepID=UPI0014255ECB|nr:uncharacterized protein LOC117108188 [Anneissia japonica]